MDHQTGTELRLEPCGLGRHYIAGVGYVYQLFHRYGVECESDGHSAVIHTLFQFAQTTYATYEIYTLIGTEVFDAQQFIEHQIRQDRDVEHAYRVIIVVTPFASLEPVPLPAQIHTELMQSGGLYNILTLTGNDEIIIEGSYELLGSHTVKILDDTVVIYDLKLTLGEYDRQKIAILLVSGMFVILFHLLASDESGGSGTMVSVRHI